MARRTRDEEGLLDQEREFVEHYIATGRKGTEAAQLAGYTGDRKVLQVTASQLLARPMVRAAYERRLREHLHVSSNEVLAMLGQQATANRVAFLDRDGNFDTAALDAAGLGWMLEGIETLERRDKDGNLIERRVKVKLASGHEARKLIAQHLGLLMDIVALRAIPSDPTELRRVAALEIERVTGRPLIDLKALPPQGEEPS